MTRCGLPSRPSRCARLALSVLLASGCAVVRAPASSLDAGVAVREGAAEPQVELWLESGSRVQQAEAEASAAQARAVLRRILSRRALAEGDQLLVVRAQGVSRTGSRRDGQEVARGVVMAGVAVAAVGTMLATVAGDDGALQLAATDEAPATLASGGGERPEVLPRPPRPPARRPLRTRPGTEAAAGDVPPGESLADLPGLPETPLEKLLLPPLPPLELGSRGFWAGDLVRVELLLVDRGTGTRLWRKWIEEEGDLRDIARMKALLDRALDEPEGWSPADPPPPAP